MLNFVIDTVTVGGQTWEIGADDRRSDSTVRVATRCSCGRVLTDMVTSLSHFVIIDCFKGRDGGCGKVHRAPPEVFEPAKELADARHDRAAVIRAASGGSRQGIPDC